MRSATAHDPTRPVHARGCVEERGAGRHAGRLGAVDGEGHENQGGPAEESGGEDERLLGAALHEMRPEKGREEGGGSRGGEDSDAQVARVQALAGDGACQADDAGK